MEHITMIMSGLALLAAMVSLILTIREKKRNQKRNADLVNLIHAECNVVKGAVTLDNDVSFTSMKDAYTQKVAEMTLSIDKISTKVDKLEQGIVPDYQEALAAKNSVDEFNRGLSAIMGYDPMEIARKTRENRQYGGEVE